MILNLMQKKIIHFFDAYISTSKDLNVMKSVGLGMKIINTIIKMFINENISQNSKKYI